MTIENYFERRIRPISEDIKPQNTIATTNTTNASNLIDEDQLARTFQEIVNCINLDDDEEDNNIHSVKLLEESRHSTMFNGHGHLLPEYESIFGGAKGSFNVTVGSKSSVSSNTVGVGVGNRKSFLDDDWFPNTNNSTSTSKTVTSSSISSSVNASNNVNLVRPPGYSNVHTSASLINRPITPSSSTGFTGRPLTFNNPPTDYVCKLCNCDGHWMKDCKLYEPRTPPPSISSNNSSSSNCSFKSINGNGYHSNTHNNSSISRTLLPPGNYVCRLCNVAGHWIDQCSKFQPKDHSSASLNYTNPSSVSTTMTLPPMLGPGPTPNYRPPAYLSKPVPSNYICNLCNRPGHWIQQCSEFTPIINHKRQ